jgi:hypothetical protein
MELVSIQLDQGPTLELDLIREEPYDDLTPFLLVLIIPGFISPRSVVCKTKQSSTRDLNPWSN